MSCSFTHLMLFTCPPGNGHLDGFQLSSKFKFAIFIPDRKQELEISSIFHWVTGQGVVGYTDSLSKGLEVLT